ncbi:putative surface protease GP63, putative,metallopeptidase [Trypanosoma theileri]|uniref:Leishmanolysin-like peptidase n=1 Tax=Trypanosoma theileri TaxID=67003 RepID=A0A1X0NZ64_9TRYP|nr:putative surface protease GP63, putative,metallopeptidase [Trypanosoma theileri]ORC89984.1 putative surface protease GP63, putative,metallopeptidase [Trypanosoma theileri]
MDNYPIIKPLIGTACEGGEESLMPGSLVSNMSRCLKAENLKLKKGDMKVLGVCAKLKCEDGKKVSVQLKGYGKDEWHNCEEDKNEIKLVGSEFSEGSIKCPKYEEVCIGLLEAEVPTSIKFYNGKSVTDGYVGDVKDEEKEAKPVQVQKLPHVSLPPPGPLVNEDGESSALDHQVAREEAASLSNPPNVNRETESLPSHPTGENVEKNIESTGLSNVGALRNDERLDTNAANPAEHSLSHKSNDTNQLTVAEQSRENESPVNSLPPAQSSPVPAPAVVGPYDRARANEDLPTEKSVEGDKTTSPKAEDQRQTPTQTPQTKVPLPNEVKTPTVESTSQLENSSTSPTEVQSDAEREELPSRNRRGTDDDASSTSNPNTVDAANESSSHTANNGTLNGTNFTEDQIKEETLKHTNVMGALGPDSSIMFTSYMAPLALLVGVVGFVMVP